jgi:hypothetical protein
MPLSNAMGHERATLKMENVSNKGCGCGASQQIGVICPMILLDEIQFTP